MELISSVAHFFMLSLALGMTIFSLLVSTKLTGAGFYKVVIGIIAGSTAIGWTLDIVSRGVFDLNSGLYVAGLLIMALMFKLHEDQRSPFIWFLFVLKLVVLLVISYFSFESNNTQFLFFLSSMALLGVVTFTMVLGHWYLVTPRLTEKPLAVGTQILWGVLFIKVCLTALSYSQNQQYFEQFSEVGMGYMFNWIMLLMRVGWGYLVIAIMSYFAYRLIRMRSLQSATGILYAMTIFVFVGELMSTYLFLQYGLMI